MAKRRTKPTKLERAIIRAIRESGLSQNALAKLSRIDQPTLSRFLSKDPQKRRGMTLAVADRLCRVLGLELVKRDKLERGK